MLTFCPDLDCTIIWAALSARYLVNFSKSFLSCMLNCADIAPHSCDDNDRAPLTGVSRPRKGKRHAAPLSQRGSTASRPRREGGGDHDPRDSFANLGGFTRTPRCNSRSPVGHDPNWNLQADLVARWHVCSASVSTSPALSSSHYVADQSDVSRSDSHSREDHA